MGRSVSLSGAIGFVLVALLVGMLLGGAITVFVIAPNIENHFQNSSNQGDNGNQNNNGNQNGNTNQAPTTSSPNNNNPNGYNNGPTANPTDNNQNNNNDNSQGMNNTNPPITNPTSQYSSTGSQFSLIVPNQNGGKDSGAISADVNCVVQQNGNSIQLDLTITPTNVPQSLSQDIQNSQVTFNFAGTTSGSQFNAQASGTGGSDSTSPTFDLDLSGSLGTNTLTITVTSASDSQIAISTPHSITLQSI